MKLYEAFQDTGFHTALMTTFGVEFEAFESIALSRFRSAACRNVILVCDAGMLGLTLAEGRLPKHAGASYLVSKAHAAGVFHPKVTVQLGRKNGDAQSHCVGRDRARQAGSQHNLQPPRLPMRARRRSRTRSRRKRQFAPHGATFSIR